MKVICSNNNPDIVQICNAYWEINTLGEFLQSTTAIGKRFGVSSNKVTQIAKEHGCAYSDNLVCSSCSIPYRYENRTDYLSAIKISDWSCNICLSNEKQIIDERKKTILFQDFIKQRENYPLSIERLNVRRAVLLLSLIRYGANEDLTFINEYLTNKTDRFSPDTDDDVDFIRELYRINGVRL